MNITFTKMHGLGNDFIMVDNMTSAFSLSSEYIASLCDRHKGIGADGLILVESSENADCFMNYYNADGSVAEMCGNGVRCTAKFYIEHISNNRDGNNTNSILRIDTRAGVKDVTIEKDGMFSVNMGKPAFSHTDFPETTTEIEGLAFTFVSVGNPHAVAFVNDLNTYDLSLLGPIIENNELFPSKINVELVQEMHPNEYKMKVWERGSGITLACGTGATGVYAIIRKYRNGPRDVTIELPGGKLFFSSSDKGDIIMRGPAEYVYEGSVIK